MTALTTFPADKRAEADAYADEIGGYVDEHYNEHGTLAVCHDRPYGLPVRLWSCIDLPEGTVLVPRSFVREDDIVVSSHSGKRRVVGADLRGTEPGTMYLRLEGITRGPEAYPGDSVIPLVSRNLRTATGPVRVSGVGWLAANAAIEVSPVADQPFEYAAVLTETGEVVGVGATERRDSAVEDVLAWRRDGYEVALRRRPVADWEDDPDQP